MRYITILTVIIFYWVIVGIGMSFLVQDKFMITPTDTINESGFTTIETGGMNLTSIDSPDTNSISKWKTAIRFLFGFSLSSNIEAPATINFIISFINWLSIIMIIICIYKIGNPISSA